MSGPDWSAVDGATLGWFVGLLALSFLVSGTEAAVLSSDAAERQRLAQTEGGAAVVERLEQLEQGAALETTLLMLRVVVTVSLIAVGIGLITSILSNALADWVAIAVLTPLIVLVPDVTAKTIAWRVNRAWVRAALRPLALVHLLVTPLRLVVAGIVTLAAMLFRIDPEDVPDGLREAEIMQLIEQGTVSGSVGERERDIVEAVFEFGELTVGRLMTPRPDLFAIPVETPWAELLATAREKGYSRIPVFHKRSDDIIGVLLLKDLLRLSVEAEHGATPGPRQLRTLLLPPTFVPQSKPANAMLREFLAKKQHMAFVVDEHGTLVGAITLDDLLAELVGDFYDEQDDADETSLAIVRPGLYKVKAWMDVDDFVEETGIEVPRDGYNTVGGFVFHQLGRLPHKGDIVHHHGHRFMVGAMEGRRIAEVLVQKVSATEGEARPDRGEALG